MIFKFFKHLNNYLLLSIILLSCQIQEPLKVHGIVYLENRSKKLEVNKSNKNDIIRIIGQPQVKGGQVNNETWIYVERVLTKGKFHKLGRNVIKENNVLILDFDKYGILKTTKFYTKDDINKIEFSKRNTENILSQKSFVENFLQSIKQKMYSNRK